MFYHMNFKCEFSNLYVELKKHENKNNLSRFMARNESFS